MNILERRNQKGDKIYFLYNYGRGPGQRPSTGIFIYTNPKDQIQKNHNKEALKLLEVKKARQQLTSRQSAVHFIAPIDITENFCKRFRQFLLMFVYIGRSLLKTRAFVVKLF